MRVLVTTQPGSGHWRPLAPFATALSGAGHEVAVVTTPDYCVYIEAAGFRCFGAGRADAFQWTAPSGVPESAERVWTRLFAGSRAEAGLLELLAIAEAWRPAVIVREISEFGGCLVAERLGIPHVSVQVSAYRPQLHQAIAPALNRLRQALGLSADPRLEMLYRHLFLTPLPPAYRDPATPYPATARAFRYASFDRHPGDRLPDWVADLGSVPVVLATLGTAYNRTPGVISAILAALRNEPLTLILTTGETEDPAAFGPQPPNVRIERYIPLSLLLPHCDLVVCHGGFGTVMTALDHGLPLVVTPLAADQPDNARCLFEQGVAPVIDSKQRSPEAIRQAVREIRGNPRYQERARHVQSAMHGLPEIGEVVGWIERLVPELP